MKEEYTKKYMLDILNKYGDVDIIQPDNGVFYAALLTVNNTKNKPTHGHTRSTLGLYNTRIFVRQYGTTECHAIENMFDFFKGILRSECGV